MPKMKTNSSAKKRFTVTGTGKVKRAKAFKNHILTKKSTKRKRALGNDAIVDVTNMSNVKFMLRIGK
ncbi:50S ribosomal protein L35 [Bacteroidota bacterium]|jgi:large subunit ribosomal protein L35|nr:MAG: 50S ribosomal protein L35 [Flavobacteriales bacterium]GDX49834.1 50S ribosomal protein L35 [Bacteroidota bacterium]